MKRLHLANIILLCTLGTLFFWPHFEKTIVHESIELPYASTCMVTTGQHVASGVLLESGYVLTAAHVIDRNSNGKIDKDEKFINLTFPHIDYEVKAKVLVTGNYLSRHNLDIAILEPGRKVPLKGVAMLTPKEYWDLKIGTPVCTIGFQQGRTPANITDGRIISKERGKFFHRNSANSYFGNSGGGMFIGDKLAGIVVAVGTGQLYLNMPIFEKRQQIGIAQVLYQVPLANSSRHMSIPAIHSLADNNDLVEALKPLPNKCPYQAWFAVIGFNLAVFFWLVLVFKLIQRWMKK